MAFTIAPELVMAGSVQQGQEQPSGGHRCLIRALHGRSLQSVIRSGRIRSRPRGEPRAWQFRRRGPGLGTCRYQLHPPDPSSVCAGWNSGSCQLRACRYNAVVTVTSWQPLDLLATVARDPLARFRNNIGAAPFLIVRLDDFSNDLGQGLAAADEAANRRRFSRAIKSTLQISTSVTEQLRVVRSEQPSSPKRGDGPGFPVPEWLNARCYVVRLSSRGEGNAPLSIGRDTSHKIVLQHPSVSATHAELTVSPELTLRDAKSRNGTFVNGAKIQGAVPVKVGDRIKFGAVQTVLCSADDLWYAVR